MEAKQNAMPKRTAMDKEREEWIRSEAKRKGNPWWRVMIRDLIVFLDRARKEYFDHLDALVDAQQKKSHNECLHWNVRRTACNNYYCSDCGKELLVNVLPDRSPPRPHFGTEGGYGHQDGGTRGEYDV